MPGRRPVDRLPGGYKKHRYHGHNYYHHRHHWYRPYWYGGYVRYWPIYPPLGYYYATLPVGYTTVVISNRAYYMSGDTYYVDADGKDGYVVAEAPEDDTAPEVIGAEASTPDPFDVLQKMSDYLAGSKQFIVTASDTYDELQDSGQKVKVTSRRTIYLSRPNKIAVEYRGKDDNRRVVYDGETVTMLDRNKNVHASVKVPGTIQGMLDTMASDYGVSVPLADMLYPNVYETILPGTRTGQYIGLHTVGVYQCHHLAFTKDAIDWEIWIQAGDKPLPRKLVITYKQSGNLRYSALITRWEMQSKIPPQVFEMNIPAGSEQIDMAPITAAQGE